MKLYKLTEKRTIKNTNGQGEKTFYYTRNDMEWGENVTNKIDNVNPKAPLCTSNWIHAYLSPELAALLMHTHVHFPTPVLWEAESSCNHIYERGDKVGVKELTTIRQIPIPKVTLQQKLAFLEKMKNYYFQNKKIEELWNKWVIEEWKVKHNEELLVCYGIIFFYGFENDEVVSELNTMHDFRWTQTAREVLYGSEQKTRASD